MDYYGVWQPASPESSHIQDSFVDHDDSGFMDGPADVQKHQQQELHEDSDANMSNDSSPFSDRDPVPVLEGGVDDDEACDVEMASSPPVRPADHVYPSGYEAVMDTDHGASWSLHYQPNDGGETDAGDVMVPSPPSTTNTMQNNHGSPE
jgi:hypothetical protein